MQDISDRHAYICLLYTSFSGIPASDNDTNVVVQAVDSVRKQDEKKPEKPVKPVEEKPVEKKADNDKMSWEK